MYYYLASTEGNTIEIIKEISEDEYSFIEKRINEIYKVKAYINKINAIEKYYEELLNYYKTYRETGDLTYIEVNLNCTLTSYLASFKKLIDNWETSITRKYGKQSEEYKKFKDILGKKYDNYMEYRVIYRLRNYDQHCGDIISEVREYVKDNKKICEICMDRDYLLNNFNEWKQDERTYLLQCDKYIDIIPIIETFHSCMLDAHKEILMIYTYDKLHEFCIDVLKIVKHIDSYNLYIMTWDFDAINSDTACEVSSVSGIYIDKKLCKDIIKLDIRSDKPGIMILYCGDKIKKYIYDCACYIDITNSRNIKIVKQNLISINNRKYTKLFSNFSSFPNLEFYGVYADIEIYKNQNQLEVEYTKYKDCMDVLIHE